MSPFLKQILSRFPPSAFAIRALQTAILPHPARSITPKVVAGPIVIAGMFNTANGLGEAARQAVRVIRAGGHDVITVDLSAPFNQTDQISDAVFVDIPNTKKGTLLLYINAPETKAALKYLGMKRWDKWRIIGCWAWELSVAPNSWLGVSRHLSEVWGCSEFVTQAFSPHLSIPLTTVPISVQAPDEIKPKSIRPASEPLHILVMADGKSSFHRKNIAAALRIYNQTFANTDDARLTIKLRNAAIYPDVLEEMTTLAAGNPHITILDKSICNAERWQMISDHDVILSAHRAEGFGLHLAEAMSLGRVVIATGWSGNMDFMDETNSIPLPYTLKPASDPYGVYQPPDNSVWADVDEVAAVKALQRIADDRASASETGARAAKSIKHTLSGKALINALGLKTD